MGNFNKPSEYIVFQMGEISINPLEINEVSVVYVSPEEDKNAESWRRKRDIAIVKTIIDT